MEWFSSPWIEVIVQVGSGMLGMMIGLTAIHWKKLTVKRFTSIFKIPIAIMAVSYIIGAVDLYLGTS